MKSPENPLVSIRCLVYNHEPFLRQCLDGFVMQKTNFAFEAIVHDDASTDNSAKIIREYAEKYPHIIKPIYETENQYSKKDGSLRKIMNKAIHPEAKYIALCEGDDYWTDPQKLQKQVDFLESHPDYSLCFHNAVVKWQNNEKADSLFSNIENRDYTGIEILKTWTIPTASVVFKKDLFYSQIYKKAVDNKDFCYGDIIIFLSNAQCGKLYGMDCIMSVYRRHEGSLVFTSNYNSKLKQIIHLKSIPRIFGIEYSSCCKSLVADICGNYGIYMFHAGEKEKSKELFQIAFKYCPAQMILFLFRRFLNYIKKIK